MGQNRIIQVLCGNYSHGGKIVFDGSLFEGTGAIFVKVFSAINLLKYVGKGVTVTFVRFFNIRILISYALVQLDLFMCRIASRKLFKCKSFGIYRS